MASRERPVRLPKLQGSERRASTRYPIGLELRYEVQRGREALETGRGHTVDLSSNGLRFLADRPLTPGQQVELAISWPLPLEGGVPLQLVASGRIVWTAGREAALQVYRHEFKTRRAGF